MKGFHVCKSGNAPQVGQVKSFLIDGDRIRSKKSEDGGQNYTITSVTPRASYKDSYGNVGYDIEVEPANGQQSLPSAPQQRAAWAGADDTKEGYWRRKEERDIEASQRMNRSHAQEMAIRYFTMIGGFGDKSATYALRTMTDWFQRDSWRTAEQPSPKQESEDVF